MKDTRGVCSAHHLFCFYLPPLVSQLFSDFLPQPSPLTSIDNLSCRSGSRPNFLFPPHLGLLLYVDVFTNPSPPLYFSFFLGKAGRKTADFDGDGLSLKIVPAPSSPPLQNRALQKSLLGSSRTSSGLFSPFRTSPPLLPRRHGQNHS